MHSSKLAEDMKGQVWVCENDQYNNERGIPYILLIGYSKPVKVKFLQKVIVPTEALSIPTRESDKPPVIINNFADSRGDYTIDMTGYEDGILKVVYVPKCETVEKGLPKGSVSLMERLHNLLVSIGIKDKATIHVYYPILGLIKEDCLAHDLEFTDLINTIYYKGETMTVIVTTY